MSRTLVAVNHQGRLTLPAAVRRQLGIGEGAQLEVSVKDHDVTLRPAMVIPAEDRWAYTPEAIASLQRSLADVKAGYVFQLTEDQLLRGTYPKAAARNVAGRSRKR
jgi:AbrB family looped-hinge helix DNA binding protein